MVEKAANANYKEEEGPISKVEATAIAPPNSGLIRRVSIKRDEESKALISHRGSTQMDDDLWPAKVDASKPKPYKLLQIEQRGYVVDYEDHLLGELIKD